MVDSARHLYTDAVWLRETYHDRRLTLRQVAAEAECSLRTICRWMEKHDIPTDRSRIGNRRRGAECYQWKGGPQPCPSCGGSRSFYSKVCQRCYDRAGANNPRWITDEARVSYALAHHRVKVARGAATEHPCAHCSNPAKHWAYDHQDPDEKPESFRPDGRRNGPYSVDVSHYLPLCVPCHKRLDLPYLRNLTASPPAVRSWSNAAKLIRNRP